MNSVLPYAISYRTPIVPHQELDARCLGEVALLAALVPPPALEASGALVAWTQTTQAVRMAAESAGVPPSPAFPSASLAALVALAAAAGLEPPLEPLGTGGTGATWDDPEEASGSRELWAALSALSAKESSQVAQHLAR